MKSLAIIPAYNEEKNIVYVIRDLQEHSPWLDLLVIDDGSADDTAELAAVAGAEVISLPVNLGIGGAVQTGFIYACKRGYDIAVQVDADGQHRSEEVKKLVAPVLEGKADVVIGSRFLQQTAYQGSPFRRFGILFLSYTIKRIVKRSFTDPTSGFRAYNRKALRILSEHYSIDYPEPDAIVTLLKNGIRLDEVSVEMNGRLHGRSSITPLRSAYYMFKVSLAIILNSMMAKLWRE